MTVPQMVGISISDVNSYCVLLVNDPGMGWVARPIVGGMPCYWVWSLTVDAATNTIWVADSEYPTNIFKSTDLGITWSLIVPRQSGSDPPELLGIDGIFIQNGQLETVEQGLLPLHLLRSSDGGVSWSDVGYATHALNWYWHSDSLSFPDGKGSVHWIYTTGFPSYETLWYARSLDNGLTIEAPIDLGTSTYSGGWSTTAIAAKDNWVYAVYIDFRTSPFRSDVWYSYSNNYGAAGSWTIKQLLYTSATNWNVRADGDNMSPYVGIDGTYVYAAVWEWQRGWPYDRHMKIYRSPLGSSWALQYTIPLPQDYYAGVGATIAPPLWDSTPAMPLFYGVYEWPSDVVQVYCNTDVVWSFDNGGDYFDFAPTLVSPVAAKNRSFWW